MLDFIISKEFNKAVELAGTVGAIWRGDPDDPVAVDLSNGLTVGHRRRRSRRGRNCGSPRSCTARSDSATR